MRVSSEVSFVPRDGGVLKVVVVCRISTDKQDERSLDDQAALVQEYVTQQYSGQVEFIPIQSQGSGEVLDRQELFQLEELIESQQIDVVISEDLSRICRRRRAFDFCELCEDCDVRLIAINDRVDTAIPGWEDSASMATWHHERSNRDTSDRIRRSLRNRFKNGGVFQCPIYGYLKPENAQGDQDVSKDPDAEPIYEHWFEMLEKGATYSDVADWLNQQQVKLGPYCRLKRWTSRVVSRITFNPLLKGERVRNRKKSKRINKTGQRKCVNADPSELLTRNCPHLAFIEPERYDRVIALLKRRNEKYYRAGANCRHKLHNVPRKRTRFPGQMIKCGICGRGFVFGGHGHRHYLTCDGARFHTCWNGVAVDGPKAAMKITEAVLSALEALPGYDQAFLAEMEEASQQYDIERLQKKKACEQRMSTLKNEIQNFMMFLRKGGFSETVSRELAEAESELKRETQQWDELCKPTSPQLQLPDLQELKLMAHQQLSELALDSWELRSLMKQLIPKIVVFPYQLCDGGACVLRARFRLQLSGFITDSRTRKILEPQWEQELSVNLFDLPQRELYRLKIMELRFDENGKRKMSEKAIARKLGLTITATQRAAALQRLMDQLEIDDPYVPLLEPPAKGKLKRHQHSRYQFEPLPDAGEI